MHSVVMDMKKRLLTFLIASFIAISTSFSATPACFAESSAEYQISDLTREAMEEYEYFEFDKASDKLKKAIEIIESNGLATHQAAQTWLYFGLVEYAYYKDTLLNIAEKRASEDFLKAVAIDSSVSIPASYSSPELEDLLSRAKELIGPSDDAPAIAAPLPTPTPPVATANLPETAPSVAATPTQPVAGDDSLVQLALLLGTGVAYFHGYTELCQDNLSCLYQDQTPGVLGPGMVHLRLSIRADLMFNLPYNLQAGAYFRYTLIDPTQLAMIAGASFRYVFQIREKFRLYAGLGIGWGAAGSTYTYSDFKTKNDEPLTDILRVGSNSHIHLMPQFGLFYMLHKNVGLAFDLSAFIHINVKDPESVSSNGSSFIPPRVSFHMDFQLGPIFRF